MLAVIFKADLHCRAVLKRLPAKAAPAEAMDGGDVGAFKPFQCLQQVAGDRATGVGILPMQCKPFLQHRIAGWDVGLGVGVVGLGLEQGL